ncbi:hypothetical protein GCM10010435_34750 [Winogradskya consettensis]|uniref:Uncharacterized protein n=1 Tax=Winogradskya consettensis TaxID=113560 RepID=A0A919SMN5_9ACTN|nr:hypothetical protein Aco04nite_40070 [Actinoplanes consettensis]
MFDARTRREITGYVFDAGKTAGITRHVFDAGKSGAVAGHVFHAGKGGGRWAAGEDPKMAGSFEQGQDAAAEGSGAAGDEKEWGHVVGRHILRGSGVKGMTPGDEGM